MRDLGVKNMMPEIKFGACTTKDRYLGKRAIQVLF